MIAEKTTFHLITFDELFGRPSSSEIVEYLKGESECILSKKVLLFLRALKSFRFAQNNKIFVPAYWVMNSPYLMLLHVKYGGDFLSQIFTFIIPQVRNEDKTSFYEMNQAYVLGNEAQSSYWGDIKKFDSNWKDISKLVSNYLNYLDQHYGQLPTIERRTNFADLFFDQLQIKFDNISYFTENYSFINESNILKKVKKGINILKTDSDNSFGMSSIVSHLNKSRNNETSCFNIMIDEYYAKEIAAFCRAAYLWSYSIYMGLSLNMLHHMWKEKWENDLAIQFCISSNDYNAGGQAFFDIESALLKDDILDRFDFIDIHKLVGIWPNDLNFKEVSDKVISGKPVREDERKAWNEVIDRMLHKNEVMKEGKSRWLSALRRTLSLLFKKGNRERLIVQYLNEQYDPETAHIPTPPIYSLIKATLRCSFGVSQIESNERRDQFINEIRRI